MGETKEVEGFRFAEPALLAPGRRMAAKLDQAGLVRMKLQSELLEPRSHRIEETAGVVLMLEAQHHIVGIAHDDHVAGGFAPSPAFGPEIEDVVQVDVGKQRRRHRTLPGSPVANRHGPVFQDTRPQPFLDEADDALVTDPVFYKSDQPFLADRVEERPDIGIKYVVHLPAGDAYRKGVQRIVRSPSRTEPVREPEKVFLVDGIQHHDGRALNDFVFQGGNCQRPLPSVRLRNVCPAGRLGPVSPTVDAAMQIDEPALKVYLVLLPRDAIHAWGGLTLEGVEGDFQSLGADMVEQRGEL